MMVDCVHLPIATELIIMATTRRCGSSSLCHIRHTRHMLGT